MPVKTASPWEQKRMELQALETDMRRAVGRRKIVEDVVAPSLVERLAVTLGCETPAARLGYPLPPGWHTIFCLQAPPRPDLNEDGLPYTYDLIPPMPMRRRLFGGARMHFHRPLIVGEAVRCESELSDVKVRTGASGHLAVATLRHRFFGENGLAVVEEQDIVHLEPVRHEEKRRVAKNAAPADSTKPVPIWNRTVTPDAITLFRFSALTFNSHRIHYDAPYAERVEQLPGLVVQGKLIALLLLDTVQQSAPSAVFKEFSYRSGQPLYAGTACTLAARIEEPGDDVRLWASGENEQVVQTASLKLARPVRG